MPSESDRPIEKQLRAYAERRRAAAGGDAFALHPVTRNALQVEVEREFGRQARFGGPRRSWLTGWWPRLALGGGALVGMVLLAVNLIPRGGSEEMSALAKAEGAVTLAPDQPAATGASKSTSMAGRRQEFQFTNAKAGTGGPATMAATPLPVSPASEPARREASEAGRRDGAVVLRSSVAAPASVATSPAPLQGTFQVVILDDQISLVDVDQSSYSGRLEPVDPMTVGTPVTDRSLSFEERYYGFVQNGVLQQVPVAAQFILTGTNRATRLPVQIVGHMVTRTQAPPTQITGDPVVKQQAGAGLGVFLQINATATMNGAAPIQIDASAQPQ